jgi:hypothetical protein
MAIFDPHLSEVVAEYFKSNQWHWILTKYCIVE